MMSLLLKCHRRFDLGERAGLSRRIDVVDESGGAVPAFDFMCDCLDSDIQHPEGSGTTYRSWLAKVESGEVEDVGIDGNAWIAHVRRDKVWFEGLYSQGAGDEVSFNQLKFAVDQYVRYLADPHRTPIEVEFPSH